ncbi:MAG: hypothetical protein IPI88_17775 [Chitinophagaceae bacterium]|nr:hypothetical protein [Chitinophagaceae bacterium]
MKSELKKYTLSSALLEVKQGFAYLSENKNNDQNDELTQMTIAMAEKEKQEKVIQHKLDSIGNMQKLGTQVYAELKAQYPALKNAVIQPSIILTDSSVTSRTFLVLLSISSRLSKQEKSKIENWLKVRLQQNNINLIFQ